MPERKAAPIKSQHEDVTKSDDSVPNDSNTVPSQTERAMPAEPANTENDKITSIKFGSETKQSKSLTIGKINEDVDRADPKESKRIPEEALGGNKTVVKGRGKGSKHKIRHALIPLKDILVSHDADFNENKDYPQELQPRDRSKGASRAKNNQVTAELDPYRLMDNYLASEGRPIVVVDKDGRVIALTGNGRLIALKRRAAGEYDGIQEYEQTLREHLEDFGFNDQDTAGKVLVGVYYGDADLIQLANAMNESEGDAMSPAEQAAADAKQIANLKKHGDDIMEALDINTEDVMSAANAGFLRLFAERLGLDITKYQTADGKWNKDFRTRVENALFMYIFNNKESAKRALSAWREDETSNMKSVLTGVMSSVKLIAKYRNAVEKYKTVDLDITVDLLEAINVITRLRKEGKTLEQEANEMDLFSDGNEAIPSDKLSLYQAIAMIKTIKRGTEFIKGYYSEAMDLADPNQMSFLYDPNTSKEDFLSQYTEGFIKRNEKKKDDRSPAQRSATETPAKTHGEDREGSGRSDRSEEDVVSGRRLRTGANESRLNSIPDSVAEDALLGLFKSHIAKTERDGRKLAITFKDGRKLTLDRLNKNFKITMPDGRKLDMYGRTYSKTIDGTFNVFMDLVDGLNGGNRTLYHEAFHVAWKLFMATEQIDMISRYYAKKLGPEASIVDIEEAAANAAQNWIGNRAEVPPGFRNIFRRFWDRVRHALVSLGLANENQKIEDIFWGLEQDRLQGKGTEDKAVRHSLEPENSSKSKQELVNPIDPKLSD
jgi:hypothetical protein